MRSEELKRKSIFEESQPVESCKSSDISKWKVAIEAITSLKDRKLNNSSSRMGEISPLVSHQSLACNLQMQHLDLTIDCLPVVLVPLYMESHAPILETESHVAQAGFELQNFLPPPPRCQHSCVCHQHWA